MTIAIMFMRIFAKLLKSNNKKSKKGAKMDKSSRWKYVAFLVLICGGALQVLLPLIDGVIDFFGPPGFVVLDPSDPELGKVFFGGHPWVVLCKNESGSNPPMWDMAAKIHKQSETPGSFSMGILDCAQPLPSGKSTYKRFKLKPPVANEYVPSPFHAFVSANGDPPKLFGEADLQLPKPKLEQANKFIDTITAKTRKTARYCHAQGDLRERCTKHKWCAVVLNDGKLDAVQKEIMTEMMNSHRLFKWVQIDTSKRTLSTASKLPEIEGLSEEATAAQPRVLVFHRKPVAGLNSKGKKNTPKLAARAHRDRFSLEKVSSFLDDLLNVTGTSTVGPRVLKTAPALYKKGKARPAKTKANKKADAPPKEASSASSAKAPEPPTGQRVATPEEVRKKQREREDRRRIAMERERQEHAMGGDPAEEDDYGEPIEDEDEEEGEDIVELDDEEAEGAAEGEEVDEEDEEEVVMHDEM